MIELGSFDAAVERLHVTPSAVSQRMKALEQRVGQVLVVREKPCTATAAGVPLLRLVAQTPLLEAEALAEMGEGMALRRELRWRSTPIRWRRGSPAYSPRSAVLFDVRIEDWGMFPDSLAASHLDDGSFRASIRRTSRRASVLAVLETR